MPRRLSANVLSVIDSNQLATTELLDIATESPFTTFNYHFTNWNESLVVAGTKHTVLGFERGDFSSEIDQGVDRVSIRIDDTNRFWSAISRNVSIAGMRVRLRKAFPGYVEVERDTITVIDGFVSAPDFGENTMAVEVRSLVAAREGELPNRLFKPQCNYYLGSPRCGIDMTLPANQKKIIASVVSTESLIRTSELSNSGGGYWVYGYAMSTSGPNAGSIRPIKDSGDGYVELGVPFNFPTGGGNFTIRRGCRKTKSDCKNRFANLNSYGGFSEVPKTPIIDA